MSYVTYTNTIFNIELPVERPFTIDMLFLLGNTIIPPSGTIYKSIEDMDEHMYACFSILLSFRPKQFQK